MSKRKKSEVPPSRRGPKGAEFLAEAPEKIVQKHQGEQAAAKAAARAEVELPPIGSEFDRAPPDYERP